MPEQRAILHVDMDAFFAAIVQRDNPETRGKPVLSGGSGKRGVVSTASYEARVYGCRSAMPIGQALRLCPQAIVMNPGPGKIREASNAIMQILHEFTPLVQPLSSDEAFCDVTGSQRLLGQPIEMARTIRSRIKERTRLTASIGVAHNKYLAKLASDLDKPDGLTVITPDRVHDILDPLSITRIWGIGPAAEKSLNRLGIRTIGDLRAMSIQSLAARFGDETALHLSRLAQGLDDRPVSPDREAKSVSHEQTFGENLTDPDEVRAVIMTQAEQVARRLRRHGRLARGVTVKIRFGDFETVTRSATLSDPTDATRAIWLAALELFDRWAQAFRPVRLIGVGAERLSEAPSDGPSPGQIGLFDAEASKRDQALDRAADSIAERFGEGAVTRGRSLKNPKPRRPGADRFGPGSHEADPNPDTSEDKKD